MTEAALEGPAGVLELTQVRRRACNEVGDRSASAPLFQNRLLRHLRKASGLLWLERSALEGQCLEAGETRIEWLVFGPM